MKIFLVASATLMRLAQQKVEKASVSTHAKSTEFARAEQLQGIAFALALEYRLRYVLQVHFTFPR